MKVALAYSGGLDTSVCIPLLKERYGAREVISVVVDVGQPDEDLKRGNERGEKLSDLHVIIDAKAEFVKDYIFPLIKANGDYEGYVLGTAIARPLIAKKVAEVAIEEGADAVAHGCTGKGNDQLRFDAVFRAMGLEVIAPMRELKVLRSEEIEYAKEKGIDIPVNKDMPWSIDENLWSRSIEGGMLEDPSFIPPAEIFSWTKSPEDAPDNAQLLKIAFREGVPVALDGTLLDGLELIRRLNEMAGEHGVGRTDIVEDRVLGLKARENYEHPAAAVLLKAHRDLEQLVLTRNELRFKALVDARWSELVYQGLLLDPLYADLNAFIDATQKRVSGEVTVKLYKGSMQIVGRRSEFALYREDWVSFDREGGIDPMAADGFSKFHGLQARMYRTGR
jgi:argininosuccinate synthase